MTTEETQSRLARLLDYLDKDPRNTRLLDDALALAIANHDLPQGLRLIDHMEAHALKDAQLHARATYVLLQAGDYAKAAEYGEYALSAGLEHPAIIFNTAFGHFYNNAYEAASNLLEQLTNASDCSTGALLLHVRALDHQERNDEAEPLAIRAVQQDPENAEALGLLALQQFENGDNPSALRSAHEALARNPNQLDALIACASAHFEQGNIEAARKTWLHTVENHPTCGRAWGGLGEVEFNELEFDQAVEHLNLAVQYMPDHIGTWHVLAWIHILRTESASAREALNKAYLLDRNFGETHGGLAVCDVLDGKEEEARQGIRRAFRLNPDCRAACYAQMLLLRREGKVEEGNQLFRNMLARTAPSGTDTGLALAEKWLATHQRKKRQTPSNQR